MQRLACLSWPRPSRFHASVRSPLLGLRKTPSAGGGDRGPRGPWAGRTPPTQAVHRADVRARRPAQQPPRVLLGEAPFPAEEGPLVLIEEKHAFQPGGTEASLHTAASAREDPLRSLNDNPCTPTVCPAVKAPDNRQNQTSCLLGSLARPAPGARSRAWDRRSGSQQPGKTGSWAACKAQPQMPPNLSPLEAGSSDKPHGAPRHPTQTLQTRVCPVRSGWWGEKA